MLIKSCHCTLSSSWKRWNRCFYFTSNPSSGPLKALFFAIIHVTEYLQNTHSNTQLLFLKVRSQWILFHTSSNSNTGQNDTPIKVGLVTWTAPGHCISGHYFVGNMQPTIESAMKEGRYGPDVVVIHIPTVPVTMVLSDGVMPCCIVNGTIFARKD